MSVNQLTSSSNKTWLNTKFGDLKIDGDLIVNDPSAIQGNSLQCVAPGIAKFVPQSATPSASFDFFSLALPTPTVTVNGSFLLNTNVIYPLVNFVATNATTITCASTGRYLLIIKLSVSSIRTSGVAIGLLKGILPVTEVNMILQNQTAGTDGAGQTAAYVLNLTIGDALKLSYQIIPTGAVFGLEPSGGFPSNIQLIKLS